MSLIRELAPYPLTWTLEKSSRPSPSNPERTQNTALLRVKETPDAQPLEMHFPAVYEMPPLEHMLAQLMKKQLPKHPALLAWLDSKGNVPVQLAMQTEDLEYIGEPVHTALRKLAHTQSSAITYTSLHRIASEDRIAIWGAVAKVVREAFDKQSPPLRRALAKAVRDEVLRVLKNRNHSVYEDDQGRIVEYTRTDEQAFALNMLHAGCELTDMAEWMWGWLGYVVKDVEDVPHDSKAQATAL
jgi:tRNA A37 threonylcarbamoyladenosine synthetase subunit TsaC/SUA5/YrdC